MSEINLDLRPLVDALCAHHRGLDRVFEQIVAEARQREPRALRSVWQSFERALLQHMETEERALLPPFEESNADETHELRREHATIRARLLELGVALDLHELKEEAVRDFATLLRAHARREELGLYPWLERHIPEESWRHLEQELASTIRDPDAADPIPGVSWH